MREPVITINGTLLTVEQAAALRIAVSVLVEFPCADVNHGLRLEEVERIIQRNREEKKT